MTARAILHLRRAVRCCAVAGWVALAGGAAAQTAPDAVPTIDLSPMLVTLDPAVAAPDAIPQSPVAIPQLDRAVGTAVAEPASTAMILPMQSQGSARVLRISGETGAARLFLDLPDVAATGPFFLSYRTSIDILPERSQLKIAINGTEIDPVTPVSSDGFQKLMLPTGLLIQGRNQIDVAITQAHRIFCGPQASFQIWTEFDLNASGVELAQGSFTLDAAWFKAALLGQVVGGTGLPMRGSAALTPAALAEIAMRLSGVAEGQGSWLRTDNAYGPALTARDLARISVIPSGLPGVSLRKGAGGAIVLVIVPESDGSLPAALDTFLPVATPMPDLPALSPGVTAVLADLGFPDTPDASHFIRHDLQFRLPDDWLSLASQRASLTLLYSFAANLPEGAILLVKVNGITLQMLPLDRKGGAALPPLDITFPARLLQPGANALTFEATVPGDPADLPCATASGPFLTILGQTALTVPAMPRMQIAAMGPTLLRLAQSDIVFPPAGGRQPDVKAEATQLALLSLMRPIEGQTGLAGARLNVVSMQSADQIPMDELGLTQRELMTLLPDAAKPLEAGPQAVAGTPSGTFLHLKDRAKTLAQDFRAVARPGDPDLHDWLANRTGDAVLIMPNAADPATLWLVIGPSADPVLVAQAVAQARVDPQGPRGQLAVLTLPDTWQDWQSTATVPALQEPLTLMNFRAVAGNFASWSPLYFVVLVFALMALSVLLALIFVVSTRGGRKQ